MDLCGSVEGELEKKRRAVEDTVSFSGGMSSCVFLFGEAAHGFQNLAGNHMLLTLGPIRRRRVGEGGEGGCERWKKRGCGEKEGREGRVP